jgi:hypothetical protein
VKWMRGRRGSQSVEFGLILPVFTSMLLFTIEFGLYFWHLQSIQSAVTEACIKASTYHVDDTDDGQPEKVARNYVVAFMNEWHGMDCDDIAFAPNCYFDMEAQKDTDDVYRIRCEAVIKYPGVVIPMDDLMDSPSVKAVHQMNMEINY